MLSSNLPPFITHIYTSYHSVRQPVCETVREKRLARPVTSGQVTSGDKLCLFITLE